MVQNLKQKKSKIYTNSLSDPVLKLKVNFLPLPPCKIDQGLKVKKNKKFTLSTWSTKRCIPVNVSIFTLNLLKKNIVIRNIGLSGTDLEEKILAG